MTALQRWGKVTLFWEFSSQLTQVIPPKLLYLELAQISSTRSLPGLVPPVTQTLRSVSRPIWALVLPPYTLCMLCVTVLVWLGGLGRGGVRTLGIYFFLLS